MLIYVTFLTTVSSTYGNLLVNTSLVLFESYPVSVPSEPVIPIALAVSSFLRMEYFASLRKSVEDMTEQATAAASKARHFAGNMSDRAQDFASVAKANAKIVAEKLREDAKILTQQKGWQEAAKQAKETLVHFPFFSSTDNQEIDESELQAYGITENYKAFVRTLDYSTFRDVNEEDLHSNISFLMSDDGILRMNAWQERHAVLALRVFHELDHLRYLLCPKRMTEEQFWRVYFSLAQPHLPEGCKTGQLPEDISSKPADLPDVKTRAPQEEEATEKPQKDGEESGGDDDDLDKYLNAVLRDEAEVSSSKDGNDEDFEDLEDYMQQLNVEMRSDQSQQDVSISSDVIESLDSSPDEKDNPSALPAPSSDAENQKSAAADNK